MLKEKDRIKRASSDIDFFTEKFGEIIYDSSQEEEPSTYDLGYEVEKVLRNCETEKEVAIVNDMLIAFCGYGLKTLVDKIRTRDKTAYAWESF